VSKGIQQIGGRVPVLCHTRTNRLIRIARERPQHGCVDAIRHRNLIPHAGISVTREALHDSGGRRLVVSYPLPHVWESVDHIEPHFVGGWLLRSALVLVWLLLLRRATNSSADSITSA
jgi:hypothetical protein